MNEVHENRLLSRWEALLPRHPLKLGRVHESDSELVPLDEARTLAVTIDTVSEEIRLGVFAKPETAGRLAVLSTVSDLAAVAADPIGLLLSVVLPEGPAGEGAQERVAAGVAAACRAAGVHVLGGDTSFGDALAVTCAGLGTVPAGQELRRVGAAPGDVVLATDRFGTGNARAAASLLGRDDLFEEDAFAPPPRLAASRALRGLATSCIDTSDGLVAALDQIARLNGVRVRVERSPRELLHPRAAAVGRALGLPPFALLAGCVGELELVFTVPAARLREVPFEVEPLGRLEEGDGLEIAGRPVDGARVRNLMGELGRDLGAYARELSAMGAGPWS